MAQFHVSPLSCLRDNNAQSHFAQAVRHFRRSILRVFLACSRGSKASQIHCFCCNVSVVNIILLCWEVLMSNTCSILETVHTIFMVHSTYLYGVLDYTHPQGLAEIPWYDRLPIDSLFARRLININCRSGGASVAVGVSYLPYMC